MDIVDVFRAPDALPEIAREAAASESGALWCQFGVINEEGDPDRRRGRSRRRRRPLPEDRACALPRPDALAGLQHAPRHRRAWRPGLTPPPGPAQGVRCAQGGRREGPALRGPPERRAPAPTRARGGAAARPGAQRGSHRAPPPPLPAPARCCAAPVRGRRRPRDPRASGSRAREPSTLDPGELEPRRSGVDPCAEHLGAGQTHLLVGARHLQGDGRDRARVGVAALCEVCAAAAKNASTPSSRSTSGREYSPRSRPHRKPERRTVSAPSAPCRPGRSGTASRTAPRPRPGSV